MSQSDNGGPLSLEPIAQELFKQLGLDALPNSERWEAYGNVRAALHAAYKVGWIDATAPEATSK